MFRELKPGVSLRTHYIVAASIWTGVGTMLLFRGATVLLDTQSKWLLLLAIVIGTGKSLVILDKSARKNISRLSKKKDGTCIGGVYSLKMWALIVVMIIFGRMLRELWLPANFVGVLYAAIGWALFFSSRLLWDNTKNFPA